jgi:hypothetical protein
MTFPFKILSNSTFTYHPFILCYIVLVTEKASLNKLQINKQVQRHVDLLVDTKVSEKLLSPTPALKMETVCFSENLPSTYKSIWRHNPENLVTDALAKEAGVHQQDEA